MDEAPDAAALGDSAGNASPLDPQLLTQPEAKLDPQLPRPELARPELPHPELPPLIDGLAPGMTIIRRVRRPPRWPGILACVLAVLMLVATAAGIQVASTGDYVTSTVLAYTAIGLSVAAIVAGLVAIIRRWGRPAGVAGAVVAVLGNPLVLLYVLGSLSGS